MSVLGCKLMVGLHVFPDSSLLQDNVAFVLCLDTLGGNDDGLYLHVSKPPKEATPQHAFLKELETVSAYHLIVRFPQNLSFCQRFICNI